MNKIAGLLLLLLPLLAACNQDNIGSIWGSRGGSGSTTTESTLAAPTDRAQSKSGQPSPDIVAPLGEGWHITTPIVVIFTEAVNQGSVYDESLSINRLYVQDKQSQTKVQSTVSFLGNGRIVVLRPAALIPGATYQIQLETGVKDLDGKTSRGTGLLGEFSTLATTATRRPRVVATFPPDDETNLPRECRPLAFLSVPVDSSTVTASSFFVRDETASGTPAVVGNPGYPLKDTITKLTSDTRILRYTPVDPLPSGSTYGVVLKDTIKAGTQALDPGTADPYSEFKVVAWLRPSDVDVGAASLTTGYPNKVNRNNLATLGLDVELPSGTLAGDQVEVRIYGGDPRTSATGDLRYAAKTASAAGGVQTLTVDFTGALGSLTGALLEDGDLTLATRISRGGVPGVWRVETGADQDTVAPTVTTLGPPHDTGDTTAFLTDLQLCSIHGLASEQLGAAEATVSGVSGTATLFASNTDGRFFLKPLDLGLLASSAGLVLNVTDKAGNLNAAATTGTVLQVGQLQGDLSGAGGTLTVDAWNLATFQPIAGATVVVESGVPTKPATGRVTATTNASGVATFASLAAGRYTITVVASGYHLASVVNTKASLVSLPLEPVTGGTATLGGTVGFTTASGRFAYVGCNVLADTVADGAVATLSSDPTAIPSTLILPNRPVLLTAEVGAFPATATATTGIFGCPAAIVTGLTTAVSPPELGITPAGSLTRSLSTTLVARVAYATTYTKDLTGKGLDTSSYATGYPRVLATATMGGLPGWSTFGVGFTSGTAAALVVNGDYAANLVSLADLTPQLWSSLEARDTDGNVARSRELFADYTLGTFVAPGLVGFPSVPTLTLASSSTGTPQLQWADVLSPGGALTGAHRVWVTDGNGRKWSLLVTDSDGTGTETLQLPDLPGASLTGLAIPSTWTVAVEAWLSVGTAESYCLSDFWRYHYTYARTKGSTTAVVP